jgi:DNA (cytosine-5)-methyltransferase 1
MENVTGLASIAGGKLIEQIVNEIKAAGFDNVDFQILKAENYGVPQERRRIVFIANRLGQPVTFPTFSHDGKKIAFTNVWDAIGDLPAISDQWQFESGARYECQAKNNYQKLMRKNSKIVENHYGPRLGKANLDRIKHIPPGGSWRDVPFDLLPAGMQKAKRSDHTKRYGRPRQTDLSCTILTKCDIHWGAYIHPVQDRAFTVREAARIQSFPDNFVFYGSMTEQFVQVGNAVPPLMARAIAEQILQVGASAVSLAA